MSRTLAPSRDATHQASRRASYRLFPVVAPTPAASPAFARLSQSVESLRRRSSSVQYGVNPTALPQLQSTSRTLLHSTRSGKDASCLQSSRPKSAVQGESVDCKSRRDSCQRPVSASKLSAEASAPDAITKDCAERPKSEPELRQRSSRDVLLTMAFDLASQASSRPGMNDLTSAFPMATTSSSAQNQNRHRNKPKPNLRINVGDEAVQDRPPPPPPKSPWLLAKAAASPKRVAQPSPDAEDITPNSDSSATASPSLAVQASYISLGADVKVRELTVHSHTTRSKPARKVLPQIPSSDSESARERAPPLLRKPVSKFSDPISVSSSNVTGESPKLTLTRSTSPVPYAGSNNASDESRKQRYIPYRPQDVRRTQTDTHQSNSKPLSQWAPRSQSLEPHNILKNSTLPEAVNRPAHSQGARSPPPDIVRPQESNDAPVRHILTSAGPLNSHPYIPSPRVPEPSPPQSTNPDVSAPSRLEVSSPVKVVSEATAAAAMTNTHGSERASTASSASPERLVKKQSSVPDVAVGAFSRAITPELSSNASRGSSIAFLDPVERLKDLTERCDVLHSRYASLRADRHKISSGIIAGLKTPELTTSAMSTLLDEQLSLAAVSSAMDICFAKLKALECQKEDAVAALVAQMSSLKKTAVDSITSSPARTLVHSSGRRTSASDPLARFGRLNADHSETERFLPAPGVSIDNITEASTRTTPSPAQELTPKAIAPQNPFHLPAGLDASPKTDSVISGDAPKTPSLESEALVIAQDANSLSVLADVLPDDIANEGTHKVRVGGPAAARLLGILARSASHKSSAVVEPADDFDGMLMQTPPQLELEISSTMQPQRPSSQDSEHEHDVTLSSADPRPLYSQTTKVPPLSSAPVTTHQPERPTTPTTMTALPVLPSGRFGSPITDTIFAPASAQESDAPGSPKSVKSVRSFKSIKSYKSTKKGYLHQTIKVFMDDDIREYYRALQRWESSA